MGKRHNSVELAFTLTDLLIVVCVLLVLLCFCLSALAAGKDRTRVAQCAANIRQFAMAMHIYGNENDDKLPLGGVGVWAWDLRWNAGSFVESTGPRWTVMFCPGTRTRFTDQDNFGLYNYFPANYHVTGYALTFATSSSLIPTNINTRLTPQSPGGAQPPPSAAQRVLLADATISAIGQNNEALRYTYNYTNILGGFPKPHLSAHLNGTIPAGGNLAMLDGHIEWRKFQDMRVRTTAATPAFWW